MINSNIFYHNINMKKTHYDNLILFIPLIILNIISLFTMHLSKLISENYLNAFNKQILFFILGYFIIFIISKINIKKLFKFIPYLYIFNVLLLILVLFIGRSINGSKCWISLGSFSFQPSELMKITLTFYLINILYSTRKRNIIYLLKIILLTIIPSILVFLEPDTGAIINYLLILFMILIFSKFNKWLYILGALLSILTTCLFLYLYFYNTDYLINILGSSIFYRMDRILNIGENYQITNALINIGSTSLFNFNLNNILLYIPEAPTDFIFAFTIGNFGLLTGIIILISYLIIFIYIINKNKNIKSKKYNNLISIFTLLLIFQITYNIAMNIGILPIMGIPLTFLSYGGTNTIISYIILGIILNIFNKSNMAYN